MNKIEKKKWQNFSIFSVIFVIVLFIVFFVAKGFTIEIAKLALTYSPVVVIFNFFWFFAVRDSQG